MLRSWSSALLATAVLVGGALSAHTIAAQPASSVESVLEEYLYTGKLEAGEKALRDIVAGEPGNAEAKFALGGVVLVRAIERFGQALHRHGLQAPRNAFLPLFGLPVAVNQRPEPLTYDQFRAILARLVQDLDAAGGELARIGDAPMKLTVDLARIRLDLDGNGVADERERLSVIIQSLAQAARRRAIAVPGGEPHAEPRSVRRHP